MVDVQLARPQVMHHHAEGPGVPVKEVLARSHVVTLVSLPESGEQGEAGVGHPGQRTLKGLVTRSAHVDDDPPVGDRLREGGQGLPLHRVGYRRGYRSLGV